MIDYNETSTSLDKLRTLHTSIIATKEIILRVETLFKFYSPEQLIYIKYVLHLT